MTTKNMRVWTGRLRLLGEATRGMVRRPGPEVDARLTLFRVGQEPQAVAVEISRDKDAFGQPRWIAARSDILAPESLCTALVMAAGVEAQPPPASPTPGRAPVDPPAHVIVVGGSWDGAMGTDSGRR